MSYTDTQAQSPLIINQMPTATYEETTKSSSEVYVVTDPAGKNMNNLTDTGYSVLNNSKALETGAICSDKKIYNDVYNYAHSTFDLSKFTVVGSPFITNDGIVTNTTTSNYLTITPQSSAGNVITIRARVNLNNVTTSSSFIYSTYLKCDFIYVSSSAKVFPRINVSDGTSNFYTRPSTYGMQADTDYIVEWSHDNVAMKSSVKLYDSEGVLLDSVTGAVNNIVVPYANLGTVQVCYAINGLVDLKYFFMAVDSIPIFSGNKTGLDTIKADNYTVVGTPTISSDGVATNFSASNKITSQNKFTIDVSKDFEVCLKLRNVLYQDGLGDTGVVEFRNVNSGAARFTLRYNGKTFYLVSGGTGNNSYSTGYRTWTYTQSFDIDVVFGLKGTSFYGKFKRSYNDNWITLDTTTIDLTDGFGESYISIGTGQPNFMTDSTGSIDLNSIEIYVNGDLVYQPCLKIPYSLSKTGSKVVDSVYRNRITDIYQQFGAAPYYTIDETNQDFTLPQGEIYGLIETTVERNQLVTQSLDVVQNSQNKGVNENIFNSLTNDFHSTYDSSKFTVTGNPTISNDGIAIQSGETAGKNIGLGVFDLKGADSWEIQIPFRFNELPSSWTGVCVLGTNTDSKSAPQIRFQNSTNLWLRASTDGSNWDAVDSAVRIEEFTKDTDYMFFLGYKNGKLYLDWTKNNGARTRAKEVTCNNITSTGTLQLLSSLSGNAWYGGNYDIDLKLVKIIRNGIPVFSGNKTGLDTIKSNDFTVVGTPAITADGVASGFTTSNYLTKSGAVTIGDDGNFRIDFNCKSTIGAAIQYITDMYSSDCEVLIRRQTNNQYFCVVFVNGTDVFNDSITDTSNNVTGYTEYQNGTYTFNLNGTEKTSTAAKISAGTYNFAVGIRLSTGTAQLALTNGSVDLNEVKVSKNGNLVYQPCLKIPYINSKDGKKMVYSIYQPRVQDCYKQFGQANYTVINEENKEYFLPLGSASGFYGKRILTDSYRNGINYWEVYSDGTIEQGGSCTSGTAVNLLKPFADTNYVVTVPYSAKTKTSFTPSQTGDWIAKGQGSL